MEFLQERGGISVRGWRRQEERLPEDRELVLEAFERFSAPPVQFRPISVDEAGEQMTEAGHDVFGRASGHEDRDDHTAIVAEDEAMITQGDLLDVAPVALRERLPNEVRQDADHAPHDIAILVRHQGAGHVLDEEAVRSDHEDLFDHGLEVLRGTLPPLDGGVQEYMENISWAPPAMQMTDPQREVDAMVRAIRAGLMSREMAVASLGYDLAEVDAQIAAGNAAADDAGIVLDSDPRRVTQQGNPAAHLGSSQVD